MNKTMKDQRASKRINYEAPVIIENCETGESYDGSAYNYSRGGMYVELDYPLKPGTGVQIETENAKYSSRPKICRARVVWCEEIPGAVVLYNFGIGILIDLTVKCSKTEKKFQVIDGGAIKK